MTHQYLTICNYRNLNLSLFNINRHNGQCSRFPNNAYQDFVAAAANVLEAKENAGALKTTATDTALENFKQKWELFRVACDQAEEFVESVKQRIGSECLVDEATGHVAGKPGQATTTGLPPISAVRLEQMSKAVRWLVIELQHGSGAGSANSALSHPSAPFDARFSEDAAQ
ncbi:mediator of RNA polymerase II transcription subunit 32 [Sesbania bispinosa]|nr:mediator of RNA polymerase II transcription subunit 32 [Sesbania bispinosa]